jgi:hypothetical protein
MILIAGAFILALLLVTAPAFLIGAAIGQIVHRLTRRE